MKKIFIRTKPRKQRKTTVRTLARRVRNIERETETLKYNATSGVIAMSSGGYIEWLTSIPEGTAQGERTGRKIAIMGVWIVGRVSTNAASDNGEQCKIQLILDKDSGSSKPLVAGLWQSTDPISQINDNAMGQYRVLRKVMVDTLPVITGASNVKTFTMHKRFKKPLICSFNGSAVVPATGVGAEQNHLYLACCGTAGANYPTYIANWTIYYRDA